MTHSLNIDCQSSFLGICLKNFWNFGIFGVMSLQFIPRIFRFMNLGLVGIHIIITRTLMKEKIDCFSRETPRSPNLKGFVDRTDPESNLIFFSQF